MAHEPGSHEPPRVGLTPTGVGRSRHLPRLAAAYYHGRACVHWTLTIDHRATGWLNSVFCSRWQLVLTHACARYRLCCPVFVLMPDHIHALLLGLSDLSVSVRVGAS
jgi:putative transposase